MPISEIDTFIARVARTTQRRAPLELISGTRKFEVSRQLGTGGFGDVYEARDREHGTLVALKRLKSSHPEFLYRFKREFRTVADLSHPNLARLYELFFEEDQWYLTMELIDGLPFDEHLARAPGDTRSCFAQLALALNTLHLAGVLHRDIKPSNALVERSGRVVLLDFGLARHQRNAARSAIAGTPPYMAPELSMGGEPTQSSDWYAFGVMLYEVLAGRKPFEGNVAEIAHAKLSGPPRTPSKHRDHGEPELEALSLSLLSPTSSERPGGPEVLATLAVARPIAPAHARTTRLVGRQIELERLRDCLQASRKQGALATVHGAPGMGKTSLVRAFADAAARDGAQIYEGRCHETESVPYKGLDAAIDMLCDDLLGRPSEQIAALMLDHLGALTQMFPVLKRVEGFARARTPEMARSPYETRQAAITCLRQLLTGIALDQPVVLWIDDFQWATNDTVQLLFELLEPPAPPILVVVAYRRDPRAESGPLESFLAGVWDLFELARLDVAVEPLDESGVAELLAQHPDSRVEHERIMRETGGHPYLLQRLIEAGTWDESRALDLTSVLAAQIDELDEEARAVLEVVSVSATTLSQRAAFAAAKISWSSVVVDELRRRSLVHCSAPGVDGVIEPYHDRVRETVLGALAAPRLRELHGSLAQFLEASVRAEPEALAYHYRSAGMLERALLWTHRAATDAASALAFARAAQLYRAAVELTEDGDERLFVLVELADALVQAGHRSEAGRTYLEAADIAAAIEDLRGAAELRARAGEHFLLAGHFERGIGLLRDSLAEVDVALPESAATAIAEAFTLGAALSTRGLEFTRRASSEVSPELRRRIDLELAVARALSLTDVRAPWVAAHALTDALDAGEPRRVQRALVYFAFNNSARAPDHPMVADAIERARQLAEELDDDAGRAWSALVNGLWTTQRDRFREGIEQLRAAERMFAANGTAYAREIAISRLAAAVMWGIYGIDLVRARSESERCAAESLSREDLFAANWLRMVLCWNELALGDPESARRHLDLARSTWPHGLDELFSATALASEIAIDLYSDPGESWRTIERVSPRFHRSFSSLIPVTRTIFFRLHSNSAMAAYASGLATYSETRERLDNAEAAIGAPVYGRAVVHVIKAHQRAVEGDVMGYIDELGEASRQWRTTGQRAAELAAVLRLHQASRRVHLAADAADELRGLSVVDPDRFAGLFVGPRIDADETLG